MNRYVFYFYLFYTIMSLLYANDRKIKISVSIPPLYFFVDKIAGDRAEISIIVPDNKNAETYEPDFKSIQTITESDMFIGIGMPFEKIWLPKILKSNNIANTTKTVMLQDMLKQPASNTESHLWLSINNAKKITHIIANTLANYDTKYADFYLNNAKKLISSLQILQVKLKPIVESMPHKDFIVYHPIFDSLDIEFGLKEHALEKHGKKYGIKDILELAELGKKLQIKRIFTQGYNKDIMALAKSIDAQVITIDPLSKDYIKNLETILLQISKSYESFNNP